MSDFVLDPAVVWSLRLALAFVFGQAAYHKLADLSTFAASTAAYRILPEALLPAAVRTMPALEAAVAAGMLTGATAPWAAALGAGLLSVYAVAIGVNLARGRRDIDCGCGTGTSTPISEALVARNAVLVLAALSAASVSSQRAVTWLDAATIAATGLTLIVIYETSQQLLALPAARRTEGAA